MGHKNADDYSKYALEAAKLMKWTSPEIKLIAAGSSNSYGGADPHGWNWTVLDYLKEYVDYIALHLYVGNRDNDYYSFNTCFKYFPKGNMDCHVLNCICWQKKSKIGLVTDFSSGANNLQINPIKPYFNKIV